MSHWSVTIAGERKQSAVVTQDYQNGYGLVSKGIYALTEGAALPAALQNSMKMAPSY